MLLKLVVSWLRWKAQRARKSDFTPQEIGTLAVVELTRLGDFITVLPSVRTFRQQFPSACIHMVVDARHASLLHMSDPDIRVIKVPNSRSPVSFFRALRAVRSVKPDLCCSMSPSNRNAALALWSGARFIVGFLRGADSLTPFLGVTAVESFGSTKDMHAIFAHENIERRSGKVFQALGVGEPEDVRRSFHAWVPEREVLSRLHARGGRIAPPYIVIHPFSGWEYRSWPLASFEELARRILVDLPYRVVFVCQVSEERQLGRLRREFGDSDRVCFFTSEDILETAALVRDADLFIGNDSGPLHLAALLGVPLVGLFGPATPALTAPLSAQGTFLYHHLSCSPCLQIHCVLPEHSCMPRITPDEVFGAVRRELGSKATSKATVHG